ncbi:MAG TPA: cation-translocating P-type ATPase, partial [Candidatus Limnocylindria bacterium]|nr:cation-translocating P-type ATPase [Candidatus Limnocylindria bacterium]
MGGGRPPHRARRAHADRRPPHLTGDGHRGSSGLNVGRDPSLVDVADVARELRTDPEHGLTAAEAAERLRQDGPNRLATQARTPAWRRFAAQFADPLIYLLLGAIVVSVLAWALDGADGVPIEALVIAGIVLGNGVLSYIQERQAEAAVAALQRMAAPTAHVVRDGDELRIAAEEVVVGDVLVVGEGDAVTADGRLVSSASFTVAEAPLTGESEPVIKHAGALAEPAGIGDRLNMLFAGTAVTRGRGRALVTATGMGTEMGRIAALLERTDDEPTPLQREISYVGRALGVAVVVIAVIVVAAILLTSEVSSARALVGVLLLGVSLAVAAVPEGLPAILTVILAVGVQRMARQNAIVKRLSSVETLGSASVICTDKTGTLTRNEMAIQRIVTHSGEVAITGTGYAPDGAFEADDGELGRGPLRTEVRVVLGAGSLANDARLVQRDDEWVAEGDPTEAAFLVAERKLGTTERRQERFHRQAEIPFSSERKLMSTVEADTGRDSEMVVMTKGAPDVLIARCTHERAGDDEVPLTDARRDAIRASVERLAGNALRTLAVAYRPLGTSEPPAADDALERDLVLAGIVGMIDPPRAEVADSIAEAQRAGIRVVMITGDHALTAARIAGDLGIGRNDAAEGPMVVTGHELEALDDEALRGAARKASVYARVAPEHKLRIVDSLQANGSIVAMTGDGVNDAPALRAADIGVAMGITGTDVAKEAANMILADDNFATIVAAVREGRAIFANIRRFLRYLLSSNAGEVLTVFLGVIGAGVIGLAQAGDGVAAPLLATQILWINLLTDSAPALALGFEPPPRDVMLHPPRRLEDRVIDRHMGITVVLVGLVMAVATLATLDLALPGGLIVGSRSLDEGRTMAFTVLVLAQLFNALNARSETGSAFDRPFTNWRLYGAIALSLVLQVSVVHVPLLNAGFGTVPLSIADWGLCALVASSVLWAEELRKL